MQVVVRLFVHCAVCSVVIGCSDGANWSQKTRPFGRRGRSGRGSAAESARATSRPPAIAGAGSRHCEDPASCSHVLNIATQRLRVKPGARPDAPDRAVAPSLPARFNSLIAGFASLLGRINSLFGRLGTLATGSTQYQRLGSRYGVRKGAETGVFAVSSRRSRNRIESYLSCRQTIIRVRDHSAKLIRRRVPGQAHRHRPPPETAALHRLQSCGCTSPGGCIGWRRARSCVERTAPAR